jgi:hypothetical protein
MSLYYCRGLYESDTTLHVFKIIFFLSFVIFYFVRLLLFQLAVCRLFSLLFSRFNKPSWMKDCSKECIYLHRNYTKFLSTFRSLNTKIQQGKGRAVVRSRFYHDLSAVYRNIPWTFTYLRILTTNYRLYFKYFALISQFYFWNRTLHF